MKKYYYDIMRVSLLNFEGGHGVPLLNFRGGAGPTFKIWGGSRAPGPRVLRSRVLGSWSHFYTMPMTNCPIIYLRLIQSVRQFNFMQSMNGNKTHGTIEGIMYISVNLHSGPFHFHKSSYRENMYLPSLQVIETLFQYVHIWDYFYNL